MTCIRHLLLVSLLAAPALATAEEWVTDKGLSHLCSGVGDESREQMKTAADASDARLVFTAGPERGYLNDVKLTLTSADKQRSTSWQAEGPICLLKLPQGNYTVDATYGDERRTAPLVIKSGKGGNTEPVIFNFKPS
ncbi:MAG: putative signal peptide protein [Rhodocyclales bacterium]|nr:putative signal peptide protein [Rhodocyclales bacterium]